MIHLFQQVVGLPVSFDSYIRHGWSLVPIPPGSKGPKTPSWNKKENCLTGSYELPQGWGVGLAHAYSGTMALDIDDWDYAKNYLASHNIDLQALFDAPDAVTVNSGRSGHGKLLYAMPMGMPMLSKKLIRTDEQGVRTNYLDFRCATSAGLTVQDVLPPSIHPDTAQPYQWGGRGKWEYLPTIPFELLTLWQSLLNQDSEKRIRTETAINTSWDEIKDAVYAIPPDTNRDEWISIGMALHYVGTQSNDLDAAYTLWDDWSSKGKKYKGSHDLHACWRSFNASDEGLRVGTIFHVANKYGYRRPTPDISSLFQNVTPGNPEFIIDQFTVQPPEIDINLFPPVLTQRAHEVSTSVGCDPLTPIMAGMSAACAAADARIRLELMDGWEVPPILWLMTIGRPADKKTPGARPMLSILKDLEKEDMKRYNDELLKWEALSAAYAASKKAYLDASRDPANMLSGGGKLDETVLPPVCAEPIKPVQLRMTVDDVTSQKLIRLCAERPRGLLAHLDEMRSWMKKICEPNSGEDGSTWTKSYEADSQTMDRVGDGKTEVNIRAENFAVAIYGNVQPQVLKRYIGALSADGTMQRFIPVILRDKMSDELGHPIHPSLTNVPQYEEMIRKIYAIPGNTKYRLSVDAFNAFREFQKWYLSNKKDDRLLLAGDAYMSAMGKLEGTCGRLILMYHLMTTPHNLEVSRTIVDIVVKLIKTYILPTLRYTYGEVGGIGTDTLDYFVMERLAQCSTVDSTVTMRELKRDLKPRLEIMGQYESKRAEMLILDAMDNMEQAHWVARIEGDKRSIVWAINPEIAKQHEEYRRQVIEARQRRRDNISQVTHGRIPYGKVRGYDTIQPRE